ncbi:HD domain-containing phosphohydrolase [Blautia sp. HCP3S3_H10_1]|uniref:HD domain-containing phosphohydrolase n=1 Tax=unclassified Blautia TaxID=2648079 RepID=UPI003F8FFB69|nr:response regulator [Clostridia bacterium]
MSEAVTQQRQKILITDDSAMNRDLLATILEDEYDIIQARDGVQAVDYLQKHAEEISLVLLDLVMPQMDGFEVLVYMNKEHWIDYTPVIIISAEDSPAYIKRGYDLGVTDFIGKPFDANMVRRRSANAILLGAKQRRMTSIVSNQIYEKEKSSKLMISILSHIVEFRNGESGLHVLHIQVITDMLLRHLVQKENNPYTISQEQIGLISTASALHDIGKITIPDEILNKPGRLTAEEFAVMKGHSMAGANMLEQLPFEQKDEPLVKAAYEICRWHHERYDGGGYPDGLKGEEIPISAQAVSLADVYDALTSERCYKAAYSHEKAIEMILAGQCGVFNPLLLECLLDISSALKKEMGVKSKVGYDGANMTNMANRFHDFEMDSSEKIVQQLECERQCFHFLADGSEHIVFTYTVSPPLLNLNESGMKRSGIREPVLSPLEKGTLGNLIEEGSLERLLNKIRQATRERPNVVSDIQVKDGRKPERYRCDCKMIWASDDSKEYTGVVGKLTDIDEDYSIVSAAKDAALEYSRSSAFSHFYDRFKTQGFAITGDEAWILLQYLQITYDLVRFVNPVTKKLLHVEQDGRVWESDFRCYAVWGRGESCSNCISATCLRTKQRIMKVEVTQDDIFQVVAMYVELEGKPCCLELVVKLDDSFIPQGYSREEVLNSIRIHKEKMYIDRVTGIYNKRYYTEKLCRMETVDALAMADIKGFKKINENFGHQTGDDVLRQVASVIHEVVGESGDALRYSGDDFVMVFSDITSENFEKMLEDIRGKVESLVFVELPGVKLELTITGVCKPGKVDDLLDQVRI